MRDERIARGEHEERGMGSTSSSMRINTSISQETNQTES
jgi:hypothetical protein